MLHRNADPQHPDAFRVRGQPQLHHVLHLFTISRTSYKPDRPSWFDPVLYVLGTVHLVFSILLVLDYFLTGVHTKKVRGVLNQSLGLIDIRSEDHHPLSC